MKSALAPNETEYPMNLHCNLLTCHCANIYAPPAEGAHLAEYGDYISLGIDLAEHYANAGGAR